ncbi:unnamed protein product, partial [Prorocentrum cordatum]
GPPSGAECVNVAFDNLPIEVPCSAGPSTPQRSPASRGATMLEERVAKKGVPLTKSYLAIRAWGPSTKVILGHLPRLVGRSRDQICQSLEMSTRMSGHVAQLCHSLGDLTPMADARGAVSGAGTARESLAKAKSGTGTDQEVPTDDEETTAACEALFNVNSDADFRAVDLREQETRCADVANMGTPMTEPLERECYFDEFQARGADLMEGCARAARPANHDAQFELRASPGAAKEGGWDFSIPEGSRRWKAQAIVDKPLVVVIGFPCVAWRSYSVNVKYLDCPELLEKPRARDRKLICIMKWTIDGQFKRGRFFSSEKPPTSSIWSDAQFCPPLKWGQTTIGRGCQHGKTGKTGLPILKAFRRYSNAPQLLAALSRRCPGLRPESGGRVHDSIENAKRTKASGEYTDEMACAILRAIQHRAAQMQPSRFADLPVAATEWEVLFSYIGLIDVPCAAPPKDQSKQGEVFQGARQ